MGIPLKNSAGHQKTRNHPAMSEWVVLDISSMTKSTKTERVLKILKDAKIDVVKITDIYPSEQRNKPVISMTVRRAHYETRTRPLTGPDPGSLRRTIHRKIQRVELSFKKEQKKEKIQNNMTFTSLLDSFQ